MEYSIQLISEMNGRTDSLVYPYLEAIYMYIASSPYKQKYFVAEETGTNILFSNYTVPTCTRTV